MDGGGVGQRTLCSCVIACGCLISRSARVALVGLVPRRNHYPTIYSQYHNTGSDAIEQRRTGRVDRWMAFGSVKCEQPVDGVFEKCLIWFWGRIYCGSDWQVSSAIHRTISVVVVTLFFFFFDTITPW